MDRIKIEKNSFLLVMISQAYSVSLIGKHNRLMSH